MERIRNFEDVKNKLQESINYYDCRIKAWESVTFPTKKDGTPFKVFSKNFAGADIGKYYPVEDAAHPYLTVYAEEKQLNGNTVYISDHLQIYMDQYNDRLPQPNPEREVVFTHYGSEREILTIDEIKTEIQALISRHEYKKKQAEYQLSIAGDVFEQINIALDGVRTVFRENNLNMTTLGFALENYIKNCRF